MIIKVPDERPINITLFIVGILVVIMTFIEVDRMKNQIKLYKESLDQKCSKGTE